MKQGATMIKKLFKMAMFLGIGVAIFLRIQYIMTPDDASLNNVQYTIQGFDTLENNVIDVLFLGASPMEFGVSPLKIYEDVAISGYNLATPGQTIEASYYLAQKAFQTQDPVVVVLHAGSLFYEDFNDLNSSWRYVLDNLNLNALKLSMAKDYGTKWYSDGWETAVFPIIKYHTRWSELSQKDFLKRKIGLYYSAGTYIDSQIVTTSITLPQVIESEERMLDSQGSILYYDRDAKDAELKEGTITGKLHDPQIAENNLEYLLKLQALCGEYGAQLVLVEIPVMQFPQLMATAWTKTKSSYMREVAEQYELPFFDFIFDYENLVDFSTDTVDGGTHLNIRGAEKMSGVLASVLVEEFQLTGTPNDTYDAMMEQYQTVRDIAMLETETNFNAYIDRLADHLTDWTVFIIGSDDFTRCLTEDDCLQLQLRLGLQLADNAEFADAYVAAIQNAEIMYEAVSDWRITHSLNVNGRKVNLIAAGWYAGPRASVVIDGTERATNVRGLNFVVFDNDSGLVIDSVAFDTFLEKRPAFRKGGSARSYLRAYESAVCFD